MWLAIRAVVDALRLRHGVIIWNASQWVVVAAVGRLFSPWVPELPPPDVAVAHRWGAAFPSKPEGGTPPAISELGGRFVAVGDYLVGPRVEGAAASAEAGARLLIEACA